MYAKPWRRAKNAQLRRASSSLKEIRLTAGSYSDLSASQARTHSGPRPARESTVLSRRRRTLLLMGAAGRCGCILELDAQPILLDPHRATISDDTIIRSHQLELLRNGDSVSDLDGGAF